MSGIHGLVAQAALETGIDYMDLGIGGVEPDILYELDEKVREAGLTFITEAGFASGTRSASSCRARLDARHAAVSSARARRASSHCAQSSLFTFSGG